MPYNENEDPKVNCDLLNRKTKSKSLESKHAFTLSAGFHYTAKAVRVSMERYKAQISSRELARRHRNKIRKMREKSKTIRRHRFIRFIAKKEHKILKKTFLSWWKYVSQNGLQRNTLKIATMFYNSQLLRRMFSILMVNTHIVCCRNIKRKKQRVQWDRWRNAYLCLKETNNVVIFYHRQKILERVFHIWHNITLNMQRKRNHWGATLRVIPGIFSQPKYSCPYRGLVSVVIVTRAFRVWHTITQIRRQVLKVVNTYYTQILMKKCMKLWKYRVTNIK